MRFDEYLYNRVLEIINSWTEKDIYAISFLVHANYGEEYNGADNIPEFSVGYNTENECNNAPLLSEERWNFAFWKQNNIDVISKENAVEGLEQLFSWYRSIGVENVGEENPDNDYDDECNYVGKGPNGYYELLCLVSEIAKRIQNSGIIKEKWGIIPIVVHDYEYCWYVLEATANANPNGEADTFLEAARNDFCE